MSSISPASSSDFSLRDTIKAAEKLQGAPGLTVDQTLIDYFQIGKSLGARQDENFELCDKATATEFANNLRPELIENLKFYLSGAEKPHVPFASSYKNTCQGTGVSFSEEIASSFRYADKILNSNTEIERALLAVHEDKEEEYTASFRPKSTRDSKGQTAHTTHQRGGPTEDPNDSRPLPSSSNQSTYYGRMKSFLSINPFLSTAIGVGGVALGLSAHAYFHQDSIVRSLCSSIIDKTGWSASGAKMDISNGLDQSTVLEGSGCRSGFFGRWAQ